MKRSRFATLAAVLAVAAVSFSTSFQAVAAEKAPVAVVHHQPGHQADGQQYAAAEQASDMRAVRLDAQPVSGSPANDSDAPVPMNTAALVLAGLAVMGSLALRRGPAQ